MATESSTCCSWRNQVQGGEWVFPSILGGLLLTWYMLELSSKRKLNTENAFRWSVANLEDIFLISDRCGRTQPTVNCTLPRQVVLGGMRKQVEGAAGNKPHTPQMVSASIPTSSVLLEFLPWHRTVTDWDMEAWTKKTLSSPSCLWSWFVWKQSNPN